MAASPIEAIGDRVQVDMGDVQGRQFDPTIFLPRGSECSGEEYKEAFRNCAQLPLISANTTRLSEFDIGEDDRLDMEDIFQEVDQCLVRTEKDADKRRHLFFIYHPSTAWHDDFVRHREAKIRIRPAFARNYTRLCAIGDQLDTVVLFMCEARRLIKKDAKENDRPMWQRWPRPPRTRLTLLIPSPRRILFHEPMSFPKALGDFAVWSPGSGRVQLSVPKTDQSGRFKDVACYMGDEKGSHRELGTQQ